MSFAPFDGVVLDDPRDPVPGALAALLHGRAERALAREEGRAPLGREALAHRARACQALLRQGLLPEDIKDLRRFGLAFDRGLQGLVRHLERYLEAVARAGFVEPFAALWTACGTREAGGRGFWVERHPEDGELPAGLEDLWPPRLRALVLLEELGGVRFRLATARGRGACALKDFREPHLMVQLLPRLEALGDLPRFGLAAPEGWGSAPWGPALDGLFLGPLVLGAGAQAALRRAETASPFEALRLGLEQVRDWTAAGIAPDRITLVHPDPASVGPLLAELLEAEGLALRSVPGAPLALGPVWAPLRALLEGLRDQDAARAGDGLAAAQSPDGEALRRWAGLLQAADQTGQGAFDLAFRALPPGDQARLREPWAQLRGLGERSQPPARWVQELEGLVSRLGLVTDPEAFYPALGLLKEATAGDPEALDLAAFLELLAPFLELGSTEPRKRRGGLRLLAPEELLRDWEGADATLVLDLGEGAWPRSPAPSPDLDWERQAALNRALRAKAQAEPGPFPADLQCFWLPRAEEGESLPKAFHRDAFAFNTALALTSRAFTALSPARDAEGTPRAQGPFWQALDGAGDWAPDPEASRSALHHRWDHALPGALDLARQALLLPQPESAEAAQTLEPPAADFAPGALDLGSDPERPLSPSRLEALARCPWQVFGERALGLPSRVEGSTHFMDLGTLMHALLERLTSGLEEAPHWPEAFHRRHGGQELRELVAEAWAEHGEAWIQRLDRPESHRSEAERRRLDWDLRAQLPFLAAFLAWDLAQDRPLPAEAAALGLDAAGPWRRRLLGTETPVGPLELACTGAAFWAAGRLDRLERWDGPGGSFLRVVDYKATGPATLKDYVAEGAPFGPHLQMPLYQRMLEQASGLPVSALLVPLKGFEPEKAEKSVVAAGFAAADAGSRARLDANLGRLVARARRGLFPPVPGPHCRHCTLGALCGRPVEIDEVAEDEEEAS